MSYEEGIKRFNRLVGSHYWKFAKTMTWCPHYYTLREGFKADEDFVFMVEFIREHGKHEFFYSKPRIYLYVDGWKYWTMGNPIEKTLLINRARIDAPIGKNK